MSRSPLQPNKQTLLRWLVANRASDLESILEAESPYTLSTLPAELTREEGRAHSLALHYVRFVARFGISCHKAIDGAHVYEAYPEDFERWIQLGAPGLVETELTNYLTNNPILNAVEPGKSNEA